MALCIVTTLLLAAIVIMGGIIAVRKEVSTPLNLFFLLAFIGLPISAYKTFELSHMLSVIPDALEISSVSYRKEESWGFGPGGNEAGIRVYPLPEHVAEQISQRGIEFFRNLPPNEDQQSREWRGYYSEWLETPILSSVHWRPEGNTYKYNIFNYICAYGFCIDIQPKVVEEATAIVNGVGNYYAYGRIGIIVVSPSKKLVLYMYNG